MVAIQQRLQIIRALRVVEYDLFSRVCKAFPYIAQLAVHIFIVRITEEKCFHLRHRHTLLPVVQFAIFRHDMIGVTAVAHGLGVTVSCLFTRPLGQRRPRFGAIISALQIQHFLSEILCFC